MEAYVGESRFVLCFRLTECYGWHKSPQERALSSTDLCDNCVPMAIPMGRAYPTSPEATVREPARLEHRQTFPAPYDPVHAWCQRSFV